MIIVLGSVVARAGREAEALALSRAHVERSRAEPGCLAHAVHQDAENPSRLVFVEQWATQAALWDHFKVPASRAFAQALAALAAQAPDIALYDANPLALPGQDAR
jgi:quinol monooxygenase YgiN